MSITAKLEVTDIQSNPLTLQEGLLQLKILINPSLRHRLRKPLLKESSYMASKIQIKSRSSLWGTKEDLEQPFHLIERPTWREESTSLSPLLELKASRAQETTRASPPLGLEAFPDSYPKAYLRAGVRQKICSHWTKKKKIKIVLTSFQKIWKLINRNRRLLLQKIMPKSEINELKVKFNSYFNIFINFFRSSLHL